LLEHLLKPCGSLLKTLNEPLLVDWVLCDGSEGESVAYAFVLFELEVWTAQILLSFLKCRFALMDEFERE